jgi:hypothetical protein
LEVALASFFQKSCFPPPHHVLTRDYTNSFVHGSFAAPTGPDNRLLAPLLESLDAASKSSEKKMPVTSAAHRFERTLKKMRSPSHFYHCSRDLCALNDDEPYLPKQGTVSDDRPVHNKGKTP